MNKRQKKKAYTKALRKLSAWIRTEGAPNRDKYIPKERQANEPAVQRSLKQSNESV